jgi:hypothetical protein
MPENINHETRWDEQKAQTIAAALKELGAIDEALRIRDITKRDRAQMALYRTDWEDGFGDYDTVHYGDDPVAAYAEYFPEESQKGAEHDRAFVSHFIDSQMISYTILYDKNPDRYAQMPTGEFMTATHSQMSEPRL